MWLFPLQGKYYTSLAETAGIENVRQVVLDIYDENRVDMLNDFLNFRRNTYKIFEDGSYVKIKG